MTEAGARKRPNILLIMTDHFRRDAIGEHTLNLNALAGAGVSFANAYCASPLCQPSRLSIATGLYPSQHGACGNQSPPIRTDYRDGTFMNRLRTAGYHTALIGKHHFIDRYGVGMDVRRDDEELRRYGLDHVHQVVDDSEHQHNDDEYTAYLDGKGLLDELRNRFGECSASGRHPFQEEDTVDGYVCRRSVEFIDSYDGDSPFYLNVGFLGPHPPYWFPGEPTVDPESCRPPLGAPDSDAVRERRARYTERIRLLDLYVGRLVDALSAKDALSDTVVIFTSDHGDCLGDFGIWDKRYFYEQSCGVPLILAGPEIPVAERQNGAKVSKALVSHLDLYPTILRLAGVDYSTERQRPGGDIVAMAAGAPGSLHHAVFAELATGMMIHTGGWKMVFDPEQGGIRYLFNLNRDPRELDNLAGVAGYEGISKTLVEGLLEHRIRLTQFTHAKEEQRLQRVRVG